MATVYSTDKVPPAPVLEIRLSPPLLSAQTDLIVALIDTGSDSSLCPLSLLKRIKAPISHPTFVRGMWGGRQIANIYLVDIHLPTGVLPDIEIAGIDDKRETFENEEIILGRNVLNKLILLLEGPKQQTSILERRPLRF